MVVKVGTMGSIVWTPEDTELVDAVRVGEDVVDTTGAGDTFTAAFAHAALSGKPLAEAARLGNAAGVLSATSLGAQARPISVSELESFA